VAVEIDRAESEIGKTIGMTLAQEGAPDGWMEQAVAAIRIVCLEKDEFTADDVWATGLEHPGEGRSFGPAMMAAARLGYCEKTDRHKQTAQVKSHAAPIAVWKSLIHRGEGPMTQSTSGWGEQVIKGGQQKVLQPRVLLYAPAGVGKSTFGSKLPKPIFIDFDRGIDDVNVDRIPGPKTWEATLSLLRSIAADPMGYQSLVIDTVDPLEEMAIDYVLQKSGKTSLGDFDFGAGYNAVAMQWKLLLAELDIARKNGMLIGLLGHAIVRQAQDPQLGSFDQFTSQLGKKVWALTQRWADLVAFATFDSALAQKKGEETRVIVTGERFLFTVRGSGFEAKNRFSMPPKLPLSWPAVEAAIARHRQSTDAVIAKIMKLAVGTPHETKARAYIEQYKTDLNALIGIEDDLRNAIQNPTPTVVPAKPATGSVQGVTPPAPASAPAPAAAPPPQSPESIELRIFQLAKGTPFEEKAKEYVVANAKNVKALLVTEEELAKAVEKWKASSAPQQTTSPGGTA
jgi:AAA domain